jgi:hypothetical protein
MKQTINLNDFRQAFHNMGRGEQFSYEALEVIYDYFEEFDPDYELDVIAICCEFAEMSLNEVIDAYDIDITYEDNVYSQVLDYISNNSIYLGDTPQGTLIFAQF